MTIPRDKITPLVFCIIANMICYTLIYKMNGRIKYDVLEIVCGFPLITLIIKIIASNFKKTA